MTKAPNTPKNTPKKSPYADEKGLILDCSNLAKLERQRAAKAERLAAKIATLKEKYESDTADMNAIIDGIRERISDYAEINHGSLTNNGKKKTLTIGACTLKWRKKAASVAITGEATDIIATLKKRRLGRCIRVKEEINKTAIKAEAERLAKKPIDGIRIIEGGETLTINTGA